MNLGHYSDKGISEIANDSFFIAPNGKTDPTAEYKAFIDLLRSYVTDGTGREQLCNFPARMTLLDPYLNWFDKKNRPQCDEYLKITKPESIKSISLIFASGYFDNPGSYYGHTLLRLNYDDSVLNQKMLDSSLNYGADITNNEGTVLYILNGLFGGYTGSYQRNNNFIHSHRYTNGQLRDLWEYELNLTPSQIRFIAEHSWEIRNAKFTYYFFNDNCAHRIINLVERATSSDLKDSHGFWLLPIQIVQSSHKKNLIVKESYHPSLKSTFTKRFEGLTKEERAGFIGFFDAIAQEKTEVASGLSTKTLFLVLDQLDIQVAKLTIDKNNSPNARETLEKQRRIVLFELLKRPSIETREKLDWNKKFTLLDYKPASVIRTGYTRRSNMGSLSVKYQAANNDLLDRSMPGQEKSRFVMGSVEADFNKDDIQIRDLTVVDVTNLNTNVLPMRLTNEFSWQVAIGYNQRNRICESCGSFGVTGKAGKAIRPTKSTLLYSLAGGRVNHRKVDGYEYVSFISENGILIDAEENGRLNIGFDYTLDIAAGSPEYIVKSDYAIDVGPANDLRFGLESDLEGSSMVTVRLGYFFN